jgi:hypothetical protein
MTDSLRFCHKNVVEAVEAISLTAPAAEKVPAKCAKLRSLLVVVIQKNTTYGLQP